MGLFTCDETRPGRQRVEVALVTSYGRAHGLCPSHQFGASIVAVLPGQFSSAPGELIGVDRELRQLTRDVCGYRRYRLKRRGDHIQRVTEPHASRGLIRMLVGKRLHGFSGERECVRD